METWALWSTQTLISLISNFYTHYTRLVWDTRNDANFKPVSIIKSWYQTSFPFNECQAERGNEASTRLQQKPPPANSIYEPIFYFVVVSDAYSPKSPITLYLCLILYGYILYKCAYVYICYHELYKMNSFCLMLYISSRQN